jgi:hypothetical protein
VPKSLLLTIDDSACAFYHYLANNHSKMRRGIPLNGTITAIDWGDGIVTTDGLS